MGEYSFAGLNRLEDYRRNRPRWIEIQTDKIGNERSDFVRQLMAPHNRRK